MLGSKAKLAVVAGGFIVCIVALPWVDYAISSTVFKTKIRHVIAHRGNGFGEPENSIAAVIKARDNGYASEIDVRMSKEGTPYVIHDKTLDRTTSCTGAFYEKSDVELDVCNVPTLDAFLKIPEIRLMMHIKNEGWGHTETLVNAIRNSLTHDQLKRHMFFIGSFAESTEKETFLKRFAAATVFFEVGTFKDIRSIASAITDKKRHGFAIGAGKLFNKDRAVRFLTRGKFTIDTFTLYHPRQTFGIPVTFVETDDAKEFDKTTESGSLVGNVYGAHIAGITLTFALAAASVGWACKKNTQKSTQQDTIAFL